MFSKWKRSFSRSAGIATVSALVFFVSTMATGGTIFYRQQALENRLLENMLWSAYQFDREVREFRLQLTETPSPDPLLLRLEILISRQALFLKGELGQAVAQVTSLRDLLQTSRTVVLELEETMALLDEPNALTAPFIERLLAQASALQDITAAVLVETNANVAETRTDEREGLIRLYGLVLVLITLLMVSGALLVRALVIESRSSLAKAQALEKQSHELNVVAQKAQTASRAKSEFMAIISHEIRTPLNGIVGMASLLEDEVTTPASRRYLAALERSATSLRYAINDILDYTKIESGYLDLDIQPFDLHRCIDELCSGYVLQCQSKATAFSYSRSAEVPSHVEGDATRIRQILMNLINNALKFTREGFVKCTVSQPQNGHIRFEVRDTGCGISEQGQALLFSPFSQVDTSISRRHEGTGLGLAICKRLVESMQGEIGVSSMEGIGSRFWLTIPLPTVEAPKADGDTYLPPRLHPGQHVLVVEDNLSNQTVARGMLERLGQRVSVVENGESALARLKARRNDIDLVLMDMQMPVLDGPETTRQWRLFERDQQLAYLPVVAMTANVMPEHRERCMQSGMDDMIHKPFTGDELYRVLCRYLALATATPTSARTGLEKPVTGEDTVDPHICKDLKETFETVALQTLLTTFLNRLSERRKRLSAYLDDGKREAFGQEMHSLKGAAASLGCTALAEWASDMEAQALNAPTDELYDALTRLKLLKRSTQRALVHEGVLSD